MMNWKTQIEPRKTVNPVVKSRSEESEERQLSSRLLQKASTAFWLQVLFGRSEGCDRHM